MSALLEARGLGRWYGPVIGLNALDLELRGGVVGLLGPNGAGKSTFLKLVAGELRPSRGHLRVLGEAPFANRAYFRRLGFAPQQDALYGDLTGLETVELLVRLHGFGVREARARAERALERVGLADARGRRTREYSKGMRQRVRIAQAFAHAPELLVLDEPLTGLGPIGRRDMLELIAALAREGAHVIVSSHVLHEVEELTSDVVLLHRGRLLAQGDVGEIRRLLSRHPRKVEIRVREGRRLARALLVLEEVGAVRLSEDGRSLSLETRDLDGFCARLPAIADAERAGIEAFESPDAGLEAVFDYLVGGSEPMTFAAATWLFFGTHVGRFFVSRRALVGAALVVLPGLVALLLANVEAGPTPRSIATHLGVLLELQVVVPLLALIVGSAVIAEEVEDRTITFLFTRPVPRTALLAGRWLAALVFVAAAVAASAALLCLGAGSAAAGTSGGGQAVDAAFARPLFEAALLAGTVYSALFAVAGVFWRHPILVGLGYAFAVEGFLANLPGGNGALTVQHHARSWLIARGPGEWRQIEALQLLQFESAGTAMLWLAAFLVAALGLGAWRITRCEFVVGS